MKFSWVVKKGRLVGAGEKHLGGMGTRIWPKGWVMLGESEGNCCWGRDGIWVVAGDLFGKNGKNLSPFLAREPGRGVLRSPGREGRGSAEGGGRHREAGRGFNESTTRMPTKPEMGK